MSRRELVASSLGTAVDLAAQGGVQRRGLASYSGAVLGAQSGEGQEGERVHSLSESTQYTVYASSSISPVFYSFIPIWQLLLCRSHWTGKERESKRERERTRFSSCPSHSVRLQQYIQWHSSLDSSQVQL